jgi:hypothetical protein
VILTSKLHESGDQVGWFDKPVCQKKSDASECIIELKHQEEGNIIAVRLRSLPEIVLVRTLSE